MNNEIKELIKYRINRAEESLEEAAILFDLGHYNTSVNRLYYACFYVVSALLLTEEMSSPKHSGVRSLFNQHWVKTSRIGKDMGRFYKLIFDYRQKGDYADFVCFDLAQVKTLMDEAKTFVDAIKSHLKFYLSEA